MANNQLISRINTLLREFMSRYDEAKSKDPSSDANGLCCRWLIEKIAQLELDMERLESRLP